MAKQTFTTGQVLTAAQLTSLQQTAMSGGAASAKTANYTLVAADAGTAISMTSTSATTITVNTGLFAAGDTVFIQNLGSGNCTITAGSATVDTAGSLILPQYDAGILYFVSASSAVFYDYIQVGATSPLTTKGDIYVYGSSDTRLPVGSNDHVLTADSSTATGLKWAAAASSGGMTLINTGGTTLTGASVTISSIPATYQHLQVILRNALPATDNTAFKVRFNSDSATNYRSGGYDGVFGAMNAAQGNLQGESDNTVSTFNLTQFYVWDYANTTTAKFYYFQQMTTNATTTANVNLESGYGVYNQTGAISAITLFPTTGNWTSGTAFVYGVK